MPTTLLFSWTDVILLALVCAFAFAGWKSGVVKMGFRLFSFFAALILAWLLYPVLAEYLRTTPLYSALFELIGGKDAVSGAAPALVPPFLQDAMARNNGILLNSLDGAADYLTQLVLNLAAFILVLIASKLLLMVLGRILDLFASLPVIGFFNRLAGMALGLLEGLLIACILLAVVYAVVPLRNNTYLSYAIEQSAATRILYLNNPLVRLVLPEPEPDTAAGSITAPPID